MYDFGQERAIFSAKELVRFMEKTNLIPRSRPPFKSLEELDSQPLRIDEVSALIAFARHLGMPSAAILKALEQT